MKQLTFDGVCKQLKQNKDFSDVLDGLGVLSGASILLLGIRSANGDISAFINALAVKDQLIDIGKCVLGKIIKDKTNECDKRMNQIQWAYSLIYYTAFFDVLDEKMPEQMRKTIALSLNEKQEIFKNVNLGERKSEDSLIDTEIFFPNIVYGYDCIESHLDTLYKSMSEGLKKFVYMLSFEENSSEQAILEFNDIIEKLPELAKERFKGQYLYLASNFNEFYIYMQIKEEKLKRLHFDELYKNIISTGCDTNRKIDVGLEHLEKILIDLPEKIHEEKVKNIVAALIEKYKKDIDKPIIDSKSNDEKLKYPTINRAFIPQSYKILQYSGTEKLEKIDTWGDREEYNDMDAFWAKYYVSHYSLENLLLILGEPGGGKSLLTKIVCARMSDSNNIFLRIPLREVSVEKEIEDIVCEQIQNDGDATEQLPTYKWFAENFRYNPITLVFDGYDEVLQATGGVYRNLLKKILKFQEQCAEKHRPVRIVVTSRETLIDKADIPVGTVVMKLLEFNATQRGEWITIWNQNNDEIFRKEGINSFMLPKNNNSIDELSRQPLLLLMLAIYDANFEDGINSLGQEENLNRTKLYNELLRRFIRRELRKGPRGDEVSYEESTEDEKEEMVNSEMEKLGIAALGMFIRGKLSLKVNEMEKDLVYMESRTPTYRNVGRMLSNAEEFFGSFFFIHDSQSGNTETEDKEVAFEFLHKTFYEFLVADLILKYLINAIDELNALKNLRKYDSYQKAMDDPNHFSKQYYTALMSAYLCIEPEIIEMIVEWKENVINGYFQGEPIDYDKIIEELFDRQIEMLCNDVFMPSIWTELLNDHVTKKSYMQYCATYFMNLLILQITTKKDSKRNMKENDWIYISQFWKMNIQEDFLLKFTSLFSVTNEQERVCIKKKELQDKIEQKQLLERQMDIFNFLQDNISYNLYCLHDEEAHHSQKQKCRETLLDSGISIRFEVLLGEIKESILGKSVHFSLEKNMKYGIDILRRMRIDTSLVLDWLLCINTYMDRMYKYPFRRINGIEDEFVEVILHAYPNDIQILYETFRYCKRLSNLGVLIKRNDSIYRSIEKIAYDNLELIVEYVDLLVLFLPNDKTEMIVDRLMSLCYRLNFQSIDLMARVLKILYVFNAENESKEILYHVIENADILYDRSPKAMLDILRICILQGRKYEIDCLIGIGCVKFVDFPYRSFEDAIDFLDTIQMTKVGQRYAEEIFHHIDKKCEFSLRRNPEMAIKFLKIVSSFDDIHRYKELIMYFYSRYDRLFYSDPNKAVIFLKITNKEVLNKYLYEVLQYSLDRFGYLIEKSFESAVDLLILCTTQKYTYEKCSYVQVCFNYFLKNDLPLDTVKIIELLDSLEKRELDNMTAFFEERYLYIVLNYPSLAQKLAERYYKSKWKRKFLDVLLNCESNYVVDREYVLCLKQLLQR